MAKYCPKCARSYGDEATYCTTEGAQLLRSPDTALTAKTFWQRWKILLLVIVCLAAGMLAALLWAGAYMRGGVAVAVEDISIARQDEGSSSGPGKVFGTIAGAAKALLGKGDLIARLRVSNNTSLSVRITSARYWVFMGDKEIGKGNWTATEGAPAAFRAHEDVTLELPLRLDSRSALAGVIESFGGKDSPLRVEGDITVSLALYSITIPFKASYAKPVELPREKPPSF